MEKTNRSVDGLNEQEKDRIRKTINEVHDSLTRIGAERDFQKEAIVDLATELNLDKKMIRRMARAFHKSNFSSEVEQNNAFENFYKAIMKLS